MKRSVFLCAAFAAIITVTPVSAAPPSSTTAEAQLMNGEAWARFCDRMKSLGNEMLADEYPGDPLARAEGYRHLARMVMLGLEWRLQYENTDFPMFMRQDDDVTQWGGPNVDNTYLRAHIDGKSNYRIDGNVNGIHNLIISTANGDMHEEKYDVGGDIDLSEMQVNPDGTFVLYVGPDKHEGNWLKTDPDVDFVMIREYFNDWSKEHPGVFHIVKVGNEGKAPPRITPAEVTEGLDRAADWIESNIRYWNRYIQDIRKEVPDNHLTPPKQVPGGSAAIAYGFGVFNLADDQALIIESDVPEASQWSMQYYTMGWYEAPDYANRVTSLNGAQTWIDSDGKVRWVVSRRDPGVPNWIDTEGRREGLLTYRWIWTKTMPTPTTRVVKAADVRKYLPKDTPTMTAAERREQIMVRRRHIERRFHQ